MLSKSSKWDLGLVHYITKFTISRFVILRFECILFRKYTTWIEMDIFEYVPFLEDSDWLTKLKSKSSNEWHLFSDQNSCMYIQHIFRWRHAICKILQRKSIVYKLYKKQRWAINRKIVQFHYTFIYPIPIAI